MEEEIDIAECAVDIKELSTDIYDKIMNTRKPDETDIEDLSMMVEDLISVADTIREEINE